MTNVALQSSDPLSRTDEDGLPGPISWDVPETAPVEAHDAEPAHDVVGRPAPGSTEPPPAAPAPVDRAPDPVIDEPESADRESSGVVSRERREAVDEARVTLDWALGPVGRRRSIALGVGVGVLTLGFGSCLWIGRMTREMREFDPRMTVRSGRTVAALAFGYLVAFLVSGLEVARVVADHLGHPVDLPLSPAATRPFVVAILLAPALVALLPVGAVALVMSAERLRVVEDRAGLAPHLQQRPVAILRWAWLPLVGTVAVAAALQSRLNSVWRIARP